MSWEDVLGELQMSEEELQSLVADVKLRAFKDGGTLKFRRSDVDAFKAEQGGEGAAPSPEDDEGPTLLEVPPAGDTQEIPALPQSGPLPATEELPSAPAPADETAPSIEPAPAESDEDEIGTELNFDEVPLGDTAELPASDPKLQDSTDTDINLEDFELDDSSGDDITDTVIPTIELSTDDEPTDDTTDTVIPTIELSADDDLTDDTSDTVIPTIELSPGGEFDVEGTETAFPTIELGEEEDSPTGAATADLPLDDFGETNQETADFGFATEGEVDLSGAATEEEIPTFEESPDVDTQQETSAVGFAPSDVSTGAETAPVGGQFTGPGDVYLPVEEFGDTRVSGVMVPFLLVTLGAFVYTGMILYSAVSVLEADFQSPPYLQTLLDFVRDSVLPKL